MAEVLVQFDAPLTGPEGRTFYARACGQPEAGAADHRWEGWIEFVPTDGTTVRRTPRETIQPNRANLLYWATGLTRVYLEGALERALANPVEREVSTATGYEPAATMRALAPDEGIPDVGFDPMAAFSEGEDVLRDELNELGPTHLFALIEHYGLLDTDPATLSGLSKRELVDRAVAAVRARVERAARSRPESSRPEAGA